MCIKIADSLPYSWQYVLEIARSLCGSSGFHNYKYEKTAHGVIRPLALQRQTARFLFMHYTRETRCAFHTTSPCYSPPESPEIKTETFFNYVSLERPTSKDFNSPLSSPLLASSSSSISSPSSVDRSTAETPSPDAGSHVGQVFISCPTHF